MDALDVCGCGLLVTWIEPRRFALCEGCARWWFVDDAGARVDVTDWLFRFLAEKANGRGGEAEEGAFRRGWQEMRSGTVRGRMRAARVARLLAGNWRAMGLAEAVERRDAEPVA